MSATWIQTYTGRKFWPLAPHENDVCIEDIAHALSLKCRYTGHCREFYSVAQHSVLVSRMVEPPDELWGLMHDAAEAYLPDVARPIKRAIRFEPVEWAVMQAVANKFSLRLPMPCSVKAADLCCLERERRQMLGEPPEEWETADCWDGDASVITCWSPLLAEMRFIKRFNELTAIAPHTEGPMQ